MLLPIPPDVIAAQARERVIDAWLGAAGISAAVLSASFAGYMLVAPPSGGSEGARAPIAAAGLLSGRLPRSLAEAPPVAGAIDFDPTGSIAPLPGATLPSSGPTPAPDAVLPDFVVRDAFEGTALVEVHGALQMVGPGSVIDGAGTVRSITRRGRGWVVATSAGLILPRR